MRNVPAGIQTRVTPSTGEVQVWPISVQVGPRSIGVAGSGVVPGWIGVVWTAGDSSVVTTGVIETGEASGIGTIARDSVGAAAAGARVFLLQAAEKTTNRTMMVLRIQ